MSPLSVPPQSLSGCIVLLVDDEAPNLDLLEAFLAPDGYRIVRSGDANSAIEQFEAQHPDIVLLDLHMPDRGGFDVLDELRKHVDPFDFMPVLVLTADASAEARARALSEGAHDFLTKPLDMIEVRLRVRNLLRTRLLHAEQRRATYAREQVLAVVAHDLRNPLSSIAMDAEMLRHLLAEDEQPAQVQAVRRIERTARRMHSLIEDLLEVTRLQHGTLAVRGELLDPADIFAEAQAMLEPLARGRGIDLTFTGPAVLRPVNVDSERMVQVLSNLVGNALRFTPSAGAVRVSWAARGGELVITVADSGIGMTDEQIARAFQPFWQGATAARTGGLGIGLVITRAIVEAHGGRTWIESAPAAGTAVHFTIPFAANRDAASRDDVATTHHASSIDTETSLRSTPELKQ